MNLRTGTISASDVAAALEVMMPFGHGSRIPKHYIENKTRQLELSSRNQQNTRSESRVTKRAINTTKNFQLPAVKSTSVVTENATSPAVEDVKHENTSDNFNQDSGAEVEESDIVSINNQPGDTDYDSVICHPSLTTEEESLIETSCDDKSSMVDSIDEDENFANDGDKPSLTTEETSVVDISEDMNGDKANVAACDEFQLVTEDASQSSNSDESLDFTISVSMTDDENENSMVKIESQAVLIEMNASIEIVNEASVAESEHISVTKTDQTMVLEGYTSVEVIPKIGGGLLRSFDDDQVSSTEEDNNVTAVNSEPEGNEISLIVNDSIAVSNEDRLTFSQSEENPGIIDMAQDNDDEEYYQSTTARDSFLVKLSLIGALNDTIYDEFVERVCEHKALIMTLVKRYDVGLLREVENKPTLRTAYLIREVEMPALEAVSQDPYKANEESDFDVRLDTNFMEHMERMRALELGLFELPDFAHIEKVMERSKLQIRETVESREEVKNEEVAERLESKVSDTEPSTIEMRDEDVEVQQEPESIEVEGSAETTKPIMFQGSGKSTPKFRAVVEDIEDANDQPPTRMQLPSSLILTRETPETVDLSISKREPHETVDLPMSRREPHETVDLSMSRRETHETIELVQESANKPAENRSASTKKYSIRRPSKRQPFASTTTLASIRAEVEAKYSKMPRPTAAFDREELYSRSSNPTNANLVYSNPTNANPVSEASAVRAASSHQAPVVCLASAHRGVPPLSKGSEEMAEIIDLVDFSEPLVDLVNFSEPLVDLVNFSEPLVDLVNFSEPLVDLVNFSEPLAMSE